MKICDRVLEELHIYTMVEVYKIFFLSLYNLQERNFSENIYISLHVFLKRQNYEYTFQNNLKD